MGFANQQINKQAVRVTSRLAIWAIVLFTHVESISAYRRFHKNSYMHITESYN